jgi:hypothetical protein
MPKNTFILPNSFLVFPRATTKISLNNSNDEVRLLYPSNDVCDKVVYESAEEGKSAALKSGQIFWTEITTPGLENIIYQSQPTGVLSSQEKNVSGEFSDNNSLVLGNISYVTQEYVVKNLLEGERKIVQIPSLEDIDSIFEIRKALASYEENEAVGDPRGVISQTDTKAAIIRVIKKATKGRFFDDPKTILFISSFVSSVLLSIWVVQIRDKFNK